MDNIVRTCLLGIGALLAACGEAPPPPLPTADPTVVAAIRAESARAAEVASLPRSSQWDLARVSERLVRAGVNPRAVDTIPSLPAFIGPVEVGRFRVGRGGDLVVMVFADSVARRAITETPWGASPLLIVSANVMAVFVGGSSSLRERVQLALEAGLPSGGTP
jgi:hypothetical protein